MSFPAKPSRPGGAYPKRRTTPGLQLRTQREQHDSSQPFGLFFALWHAIQSQFSHGIRGTGPPCSQQALPAVLEIPQPRSCCSQPVFLLLVFTVPFISKYILLSLQVTAPLQLFSLKILPAVGKPQKCSSRYMHQLVSATRMLSTRFLLSALYQPSP